MYRNPCTGTWICDSVGTRARPGPDSARTVCRTHLEAVRVAVTAAPARQLPADARFPVLDDVHPAEG
ncbi:hypothetical protein [Saccharopolyspora mangrovi]|uniref:Uncharacterized protein n=1 Tax=Saccharopolyspora mangrovi TaxID=3082379 RepID=A0ABU6AE44_9PSEU|nr:hypothetical protein [Saccharopolyspora sp. S2-29]MEB3369721.1 hypothetical protein [Saccharopolyspora sp. S2-29]